MEMKRKMYNVASGPSVYPESVLKRIAQGIVNYKGKDISTLEIGHRSETFFEILDELITLSKKILQVPDDFSILYLQGGGRLHFAQIPMNFLGPEEKSQFIDTGYWSNKAVEYSQYYGQTEVLASSSAEAIQGIPKVVTSNLDGRYLQYCSNNTIQGTQFHVLPSANIPVVVDMSSDIFSRPIDFSKVDLVLACAQKNFGPAGMSLIIIKNDFLATAKKEIPAIFNYKNLAAKNSNYNTPPIFQLCASLEMLHWIEEKGGIEVLEKETSERAALLYDAIDKSDLVRNHIQTEHRSKMNIVFDAESDSVSDILTRKFALANISGIKGHKARGGYRVGNYIGQSLEAIRTITEIIE